METVETNPLIESRPTLPTVDSPEVAAPDLNEWLTSNPENRGEAAESTPPLSVQPVPLVTIAEPLTATNVLEGTELASSITPEQLPQLVKEVKHGGDLSDLAASMTNARSS